MQNAFHFFERRFHASQSGAAGAMRDDVLSGYSCASTEVAQESLPDDGGRGQTETYYCNVICHSCGPDGVDEALHPESVEAVEAINQCIAATQGAIVQVTGDTVLARFERLDSALRCAISVRLAVRRFATCVGSAQSLRFHVGVHCSEDASDDDEHHQVGSGRFARSSGPLHYGGICFSRSIHASLKNQSSFKYFSLGKRYVKNINAPVEVFWLAFSKEQIIQPDRTGAEVDSQVFYE